VSHGLAQARVTRGAGSRSRCPSCQTRRVCRTAPWDPKNRGHPPLCRLSATRPTVALMNNQAVHGASDSAPPRVGYDPAFLLAEVPLPQVPRERELAQLDYTHFTVLMDRSRRLAAATAVNINGGDLVDLERGDDWHLDPRLPASDQAGPELYGNNELDRGHLVRRRDPVWGVPPKTQAHCSACSSFS
jgi:DNA/RNA endonuclease G (NUC1)